MDITWTDLLDSVKKNNNQEAEAELYKRSHRHLLKLIDDYIKLGKTNNSIFGTLIAEGLESKIRSNMKELIEDAQVKTISKFKTPLYDSFGFIRYLDKAAINTIRKYINDDRKEIEFQKKIIDIDKFKDDNSNSNKREIEDIEDKRYIESPTIGVKWDALDYLYEELQNYDEVYETILLERDRDGKAFSEISQSLQLKGVQLNAGQVDSRYKYISKKIYQKIRKKFMEKKNELH
ncbi:MAG: hypothetical protein ABII25_09150 [bacterium]